MTLLNQLLRMIFGGSLAVTLPTSPGQHPQASLDEILTYECAKSVANMLDPVDQAGPVFSVYDLVFAGIEASDNTRLLILSAGEGTYAVPLTHSGVNRIRFQLPAQGSNQPREYFLGFLYDPMTRSRFFDLSAGRVPMGKEETDFEYVVPRRAQAFLPNLEYKIHETAESLLLALKENRIDRIDVVSQKAHNCEHITRKSPALGLHLKHNLEVVETIVISPKSKPVRTVAAVAAMTPASSRAPASLAVVNKKAD